MRNRRFQRLTACASLVTIAAAMVTGCSSTKSSSTTASSSSTAATTTTSATAAASADPALTQAVTSAYQTLFDATLPIAQRTSAVENGTALTPALSTLAANPQTQGTSATVSSVLRADASHAHVTYTLLIHGNPVLPNQNGQAVQVGGQWKVAAATFCTLLTLQGTHSPAC
ncbi:hypothetical protein NRB20_40690 [Nocardia sp. RB20]|uniref:Low molecular weight antigen MTB12-like C-terminal domain-containing protein n=1 Tax=Nocardia macrotermitis TaxID=2585198 RepID=A0A7K0D5F2_9NOCA|nr:hypothetical protein [Nocardia macrotermitis]